MGVTVMWAAEGLVLKYAYYPDAAAFELYARDGDRTLERAPPEDLEDVGALVLLDDAGEEVAVWLGNAEMPDAVTEGPIFPTATGECLEVS